MSALDQPLLIANSGYHIGHQMSIRAAEEQGFFREEGLTDYVYESGGLVPGPFEREALGLVLKERGVDVATAVNVDSLILHRARGADLYIVGGWRHMPAVKLYAAPHIASLEQLRGARIGGREPGGISELFITYCLSKVGLNAASDVRWVYDPVFAYRRDPAHMEALLAGKVDATESAPPYADELLSRGYHLVLDSDQVYPSGRPGKAIVASSRTIERRGDELRAFLRANIRGFWFVRNSANFDYLRDLEVRLRQATHNEDERQLRIVTDPKKLEEWIMPVRGYFNADSLARVIDEMVTLGKLREPLPVAEVLRDEPARQAFQELSSRPELRPALDKALASERYG